MDIVADDNIMWEDQYIAVKWSRMAIVEACQGDIPQASSKVVPQ